jgi:hypothetical protein
VDIDREIGDRIRRVDDTLDTAMVDAVLDGRSFERSAHEDRLADDRMLPTRDAALAVKPHFDAMQDHRPVEAASEVVLARPHQVDWRTALDGFGHFSELDRPIGERVTAPSEAAAAQQRVDLDLLGLQSEYLRRHQLIDALQLAA